MVVLELCMSPGFGGLELYVAQTINILKKSNHNIFCVLQKNSTISKEISIRAQYISSLRAASRYLPLYSAYKVAKLIDRFKVDIIHMHWAKDLSLAILAKRFSKRKPRLVYTRHMAILGRKHDFYHNMMYRNIDRMLVITEEMRIQAIRNLPLPQQNISLLYLGTDTNRENYSGCESTLEKLGVSKKAFVVGLVGRIERAKGQHLLIEAIAELTKLGYSNVVGIVVGRSKHPEYVAYLKKLAADYGLKDRIIFYGFHPSPTELMQCFDAAVLTTSHETFGLTLIEAMSVGVPVIGTNAGGVPEIIQDGRTGLLVNPDDAKDLSRSILTYYKNRDLREKLARNGKELVCTKFNIDTHYQALVDIFQDLDAN